MLLISDHWLLPHFVLLSSDYSEIEENNFPFIFFNRVDTKLFLDVDNGYSTGAGSIPKSIVAGDLNEDGVVANEGIYIP